MKLSPIATDITKQVLELLNPEKIFTELIQISNDKISIHGDLFPIKGSIHLFAIGKAASFELRALHKVLDGTDLKSRVVNSVSYTKDGHSCDESFRQIVGSHPLVSDKNLEMTQEFILELSRIPESDTLIFLLSGGASALLEQPVDGVRFDDLLKVHKDLLASGMNINEMNEIRKSLSQVKNGGLLNKIGTSHILQLITCDIPNESIGDVSSGPLFYQPLDYDKINNYLEKFSLKVSPMEEPNKYAKSYIIQSASQLLVKLSEKYKYSPGKIFDTTCTEVIKELSLNLPKPSEVIVSGGEGTVAVPPDAGKGGRNTHFVLYMAEVLYLDEQNRDIEILSIGTDGSDGDTDAAGAYINYELYESLDCSKYLSNFDSYTYFEKLGTLIKSGPTMNNLMDLRFLWRS